MWYGHRMNWCVCWRTTLPELSKLMFSLGRWFGRRLVAKVCWPHRSMSLRASPKARPQGTEASWVASGVLGSCQRWSCLGPCLWRTAGARASLQFFGFAKEDRHSSLIVSKHSLCEYRSSLPLTVVWVRVSGGLCCWPAIGPRSSSGAKTGQRQLRTWTWCHSQSKPSASRRCQKCSSFGFGWLRCSPCSARQRSNKPTLLNLTCRCARRSFRRYLRSMRWGFAQFAAIAALLLLHSSPRRLSCKEVCGVVWASQIFVVAWVSIAFWRAFFS